ncbi:MAG: TAT-variant-translocated molybdopterin oxidoreductase [Flavobacteriales bacterium]|nr:TAT-variant-translocated molybdopterin oxidoreductase [Flavobacteriales bacterium]
MATKKTYFQGLGELANNPELEQLQHKEFAEKLPTEAFLGDEEKLSESSTSRRDFLKFLGFSTAAASLAACEAPVQKVIPFVVKPEETIAGNANWYASSFYDGNDYASLLVKNREGRPIFLKANDLSKEGGITARVQASVLNLYDSSRLKEPTAKGQKTSWRKADRAIVKGLNAAKSSGKQVVLLSSSIVSPSTKAVIKEFASKYGAKHVTYDALSVSAMLDANKESFGVRALPTYHFDKADVVVSFAADFIGDWLDSGHGKDYAAKRNPNASPMSRHYQFESNLSLTGANADYRTPVKASELGVALVTLYNLVAKKAGAKLVNTPASGYNTQLQKAANDLWDAKGKSLVVAGGNDKNIHTVVNAINDLLDNMGKTIDFKKRSYLKQGNDADVATLLNDMKAGKVGALIAYNANPVYNLAEGADFAEALSKVDLSVSFASKNDETTSLVDYVCPDHNYLESWGDANPYTGVYALVQPTINPLFNTRQAQASLMSWTGLGDDFYSYVKTYWNRYVLGSTSWNTALHDGVYTSKATERSLTRRGSIVSATKALSKLSSDSIDLVLYSKTGIGSGEYANNPWLQELPDPISKTTWDNYLTVSPRFAKELGLNNEYVSNGALNGDVVDLTVGGTTLRVPVLIQPGQAYKTVGLALGYGRQGVGKAGDGVGVNAFALASDFNTTLSNASLSKVEGEVHEFACTQLHHTMMGRDRIVKETTLDAYQQDPRSGNEQMMLETHKGPLEPEKITLWEEHDRDVHWWNLSVDLNGCTGCGACVIACHAENNVPVVGKEEIRRSRDMHWLRIDRYYSSDMTEERAEEEEVSTIDKYLAMEVASEAESLEVVFQPVMCQHCNHAPCETVCPVAATTHSREGLNHMTYNRCVGTRYCANNCPYKVRRFNWFNYSENDQFDFYMNDDLGKMVLNPDVVVRSRGVMEKCSMCIQMLQKVKLDAKKDGRKLRAGEAQTACSIACDTGALTFGDVLDEKSEVYTESKSPRAYHLLEELNTQPSVWYQTKVRNKG